MSSHDQLEENFTGTLDRELKDIRSGTEQQAQNLQEEYKSELQAAQKDFTAAVGSLRRGCGSSTRPTRFGGDMNLASIADKVKH
jgi:hypothetical protein